MLDLQMSAADCPPSGRLSDLRFSRHAAQSDRHCSQRPGSGDFLRERFKSFNRGRPVEEDPCRLALGAWLLRAVQVAKAWRAASRGHPKQPELCATAAPPRKPWTSTTSPSSQPRAGFPPSGVALQSFSATLSTLRVTEEE